MVRKHSWPSKNLSAPDSLKWIKGQSRFKMDYESDSSFNISDLILIWKTSVSNEKKKYPKDKMKNVNIIWLNYKIELQEKITFC